MLDGKLALIFMAVFLTALLHCSCNACTLLHKTTILVHRGQHVAAQGFDTMVGLQKTSMLLHRPGRLHKAFIIWMGCAQLECRPCVTRMQAPCR